MNKTLMNNACKRGLAAAALAVLSLGLAGTAHAQVVNGGFNTDLTGWTVLGNASVQPGAPEGAGWLLLDNGGVVADAGALALAAGLPDVTVLDLNGSTAYEGSMVWQSFNAQAGQKISFTWQFGTDETSTDPQFQDYAFVVVDGQFTRLGGVGDAPATAQNLSFALQTGGSHSVAFGVVDLGDYTVDSRLSVDSVQLTAVPTPVPEPGSAALMLAGLGALALRARRTIRR